MTRERKRSGRWKGSAKKSGKKSREQKVRAKMEADGREKTGEFLLRSALLLSLPLPSSSLLLFFFIRKEKVVVSISLTLPLSLSLSLSPSLLLYFCTFLFPLLLPPIMFDIYLYLSPIVFVPSLPLFLFLFLLLLPFLPTVLLPLSLRRKKDDSQGRRQVKGRANRRMAEGEQEPGQ